MLQFFLGAKLLSEPVIPLHKFKLMQYYSFIYHRQTINKHYNRMFTIPLVLTPDGKSEIGAHVRSKLKDV